LFIRVRTQNCDLIRVRVRNVDPQSDLIRVFDAPMVETDDRSRCMTGEENLA
jgi:hypothetical protein